MNHRGVFILFNLALITLFVFYQNTVFGSTKELSTNNLVSENELVINFESTNAKNEFLVKHQVKSQNINQIGKTNFYRLKLRKNENADFLISRFKKDAGVENVEKNDPVRASNLPTPNDTYYSYQAGIAQDRAAYGWNISTGVDTNVIAIIDTGVDYNHNDLNAKVWTNAGEMGDDGLGGQKQTNGIDDDGNDYIDDWRGWDFVNPDNDPDDDHGHGTFVSGIAAAETNNNLGIAGADWSAKIMILKVLDAWGSGSEADVAEAIDYAAHNGANVISMSLGGSSPNAAMENAINDAYTNHNKVLVAASGNYPYCVSGGDNGVNWPAAYTNVIAVGSVKSTDAHSSFSCSGPEVDVVAPGESVLGALPGDSYTYGTGTSASTPQVSGLASLILSKFNTLTNAQVRLRIERNADKVSGLGWSTRNNYYGYGRVNFMRSMLTLQKGSASTVYLISFDSLTKHQIYNSAATNGWLFSSYDVETVDDGVIEAYITGEPVYNLSRSIGSGNIYLMDQGKRKWVSNSRALDGYRFSLSRVSDLSTDLLGGYTTGQNLSILSKGSTGINYITQLGIRRRIYNSAVFREWGFSSANLTNLSSQFLGQYTVGKSLKYLARSEATHRRYYVQNHTRYWITSTAAFYKHGFNPNDLVTVSSSLLSWLAKGRNLY